MCFFIRIFSLKHRIQHRILCHGLQSCRHKFIFILALFHSHCKKQYTELRVETLVHAKLKVYQHAFKTKLPKKNTAPPHALLF